MERIRYLEKITTHLRIHPACGILGPRQVGKTTLARSYAEHYFPGDVAFLDLENPLDLARLENPMLALSSITQKLIVIDEIQRKPELFSVLRVLIDQEKPDRRFLILGSASRDLIHQSSESLAGRIGYIELSPFALFEVQDSSRLWVRGGFPRSYLASSDSDSYLWRQSYLTTFLERDIPNLGFTVPAQQMNRFWLMLAHYHGQIFNASELSKSLMISDKTVRTYLDILAGTFMVRMLSPWFENLHKRQVKSPKIYFRDSGIIYALLGIRDASQLYIHPRMGSFWEGFALEELIRTLDASPQECYFWATHSDVELDLLIVKDGKRMGFEFKYTDSPKITRSMHTAYADLKLDHLVLMYPGSAIFPLAENISACGVDTLGTGELIKTILR